MQQGWERAERTKRKTAKVSDAKSVQKDYRILTCSQGMRRKAATTQRQQQQQQEQQQEQQRQQQQQHDLYSNIERFDRWTVWEAMIPKVDDPSYNEKIVVCIISHNKVLKLQKKDGNTKRQERPPFVVVVPLVVVAAKSHGLVPLAWEGCQIEGRPPRFAVCGQVRCICVSRLKSQLGLWLADDSKERIEQSLKTVLCRTLWYASTFQYFGRARSVEYMHATRVKNETNRSGKNDSTNCNMGGGEARGLVFGKSSSPLTLLASQEKEFLILPVCVVRSEVEFVPEDLRITMRYADFGWGKLREKDACVSPIDMRPFRAQTCPDNFTFRNSERTRYFMAELWKCQATYLGLTE